MLESELNAGLAQTVSALEGRLADAESEVAKTKQLVSERDDTVAELKEALSAASELEEQTVSDLEEKLAGAEVEVESAWDAVKAKDREIAGMKEQLQDTTSATEASVAHAERAAVVEVRLQEAVAAHESEKVPTD